MAFILNDPLTEIRIYDERADSTQSLHARQPTPEEQLRYDRERVVQRRGKVLNLMRQARLKYGCLVLDHPQAAATPRDDGYGLMRDGQFVPLTADVDEVPVDVDQLKTEYAKAYGQEWAGWVGSLPSWKLFLLAHAPTHIERVASVMFEGAADYKQAQAEDGAEDEPGN